jgi:hypothetical protein
VKGELYSRAIQARSAILAAVYNMLTYASFAAPIHAAWAVDVYKFRYDCQSLLSRNIKVNNQKIEGKT